MGLVLVLRSCLVLTTMLTAAEVVTGRATSGLDDSSADDVYVVEMPVIVDGLGVARWKEITGTNNQYDVYAEIRSFLTEAAQMFTTLEKWGDDLKIRLDVSIHLFQTNLLSSDTIHGQKALDEFQTWLKTDFKRNYDVAMLYTGADLLGYRNRSATNGYANMASVCLNSSLFVLEVTGGYADAITLTHEASHVLGAYHDGQKGALECSAKPIATTIMGPAVTGKSPHQYFFSECSYKSILATVSGSQGQCLKDGDIHSTLVPGGDPKPGLFLTPDDTCRRHVASWSYIDRAEHHRKRKWYGMCVFVYCVDGRKGHPARTRVATHQGMRCGKNKQCVQGKCVEANDGSPYITDSCPLGDQPILENGRKCSNLSPEECYTFGIQCCQSCDGNMLFPKTNITSDEACKDLGGSDAWPSGRSVDDNLYGGDDLCARLVCSSSQTGDSVYNPEHKTFTAPNGLRCEENKRCYEGRCVGSKN